MDGNSAQEGEPIPASCIAMAMGSGDARKEVAVIRPFDFTDEQTGDTISVSLSPQYSKITVNQRTYYFHRETGEFDGAATAFQIRGPIAL